ncbi:unnamed protein product, partial [Musa textilis]
KIVYIRYNRLHCSNDQTKIQLICLVESCGLITAGHRFTTMPSDITQVSPRCAQRNFFVIRM